MRVIVLGVVFISMAGPAMADACRLSTNQCSVIAKEIAAEQINVLRDQQTWGFDLTPYQRGREIIVRYFRRKAERYKHLPVPIANEWARMELCDEPQLSSDPRCR